MLPSSGKLNAVSMSSVKPFATLGAACALLFAAGLLSIVAVRRLDVRAAALPRGQKTYSRTLVEGLSVSRHGLYGVDLVKCRSCRLQKRKQGIVTLGAMNVLVIDDLSVVLPRDGDFESVAPDEGDADARTFARRIGVSDRFLAVRGVAPRFSGLRINGLSVSRLTDEDKPEVAFTAKSAEAVRGGLRLSGCVVHEADRPPVPVSGAMLARCDRKLCLTWNGGQMDLN